MPGLSKSLIKPVENRAFWSKKDPKNAPEAEVEVKMHARPRWRREAEAEVQILIQGGGLGPRENSAPGRAYTGGGSGGPDFHLRLGPPPRGDRLCALPCISAGSHVAGTGLDSPLTYPATVWF